MESGERWRGCAVVGNNKGETVSISNMQNPLSRALLHIYVIVVVAYLIRLMSVQLH